MTNHEIAKRLREHAAELDRQGGNLFRRRAFRAAADAVDRLPRPVGEMIAAEGRKGLEMLPGIGRSLAYTIEAMASVGELRILDGAEEPHRRLTSLPGVGVVLAEQLQDRLGISTIEQLAVAVKQDRLGEVGVGTKRLAALRAVLEMRHRQAEHPEAPRDEPGVETLLAADAEYRRAVEEQALPLRAPLANNADARRWLGILRTNRDGWRLRALFSNTAVAHRLQKTNDWVVIYFERGREDECRAYYQPCQPAA